ncbi:uncharacterized protein LOC100908119 [Galendromus occidentalis]|uniref:Uncharacterized protein LOC100908119 n=1 Tax=Galendromus occidentalis TaxID=34638 RepID=A0AAJ6QQQ7_9ACAR|nr:uncharacterized protein LOC100908119 [Galendromus occidentalis]
MALWVVFLAGLAAAQLDGDRRSGQVIRCHTCEADFSSERYDITHPCLVGDRRDNSRDLAQCSRNSRFCKAEVTRQHGLLVSFGRSCAEYCVENCVTKGFGIVRETCIYCCTNDASCKETVGETAAAPQAREYSMTISDDSSSSFFAVITVKDDGNTKPHSHSLQFLSGTVCRAIE